MKNFEPDPLERHFSPKTIAEIWGLSESTIHNLFRDEPGVLKHGEEFQRGKRGYVTMRIPESVMRRVYKERLKTAA